MHNPLMLNGGQVVDPLSERIEELEAENRMLQEQLAAAQRQIIDAKKESARAVAGLRKSLSPLFNSLNVLFGEMDAAGIAEDTPGSSTTQPSTDPRWQSWKQRMPGRPAEMIDLLLLHGSMSVKNLMAAMHCGKNAVYQAASKLGQAGVVVNSNGRYSLKQN